MRSVIYSMSVSLDGYIVGPDGSFDWTTPDRTSFASSPIGTRELAAHVMGRNGCTKRCCTGRPSTRIRQLASTHASSGASIWRPLPKVVFSDYVVSGGEGNARLASGGLVEED